MAPDRITFDVSGFVGMDSTLQLLNGTAPRGTASWFCFNTANSKLFWDADGTGAGNAVLVATLTGVSVLQAGDIELFG